MYCKYQRLVFRRRGVLPADRMTNRRNISTDGANASVEFVAQWSLIDNRQYYAVKILYSVKLQNNILIIVASGCSYVIRSPAVLTTWNSTGRASTARECYKLSLLELARLISLHSLCYLEFRLGIVPQAAKKTMAESIVFSEAWQC